MELISAVCKQTVINMATMRIFPVIFHRLEMFTIGT